MKIKSYLPVFTGFGYTIFEYDNEEYDIENYNVEYGTDLNWEDFDWDYKDYKQRVSEQCISEIWNYLKHDGFDIDIELDELYSPREYNFSNDIIWVTYTLPEEDFYNMMDYVFHIHKDDFQKFLIDNYASREGFVSFVGGDIDEWENVHLKPHSKHFEKCFGALLEFYFKNEGYTEGDLHDAVQCESYIDFEPRVKVEL